MLQHISWLRRAIALLGLMVTLWASLSGCGAAQRIDGLEPNTLPVNIRSDYALFAQRCSRCHTVDRTLSAGIEDMDHWHLYVERMRNMQNSGISVQDLGPIYRFLEYLTAHPRAVRAQERP